MELTLRNGEYARGETGTLVRAEGTQALLQRALFALTCRRGSFPLLPELGSRLHTLLREKPSARAALARQYCAEALAPLGLTVTQVDLRDDESGAAHLSVRVRTEEGDQTLEVEL